MILSSAPMVSPPLAVTTSAAVTEPQVMSLVPRFKFPLVMSNATTGVRMTKQVNVFATAVVVVRVKEEVLMVTEVTLAPFEEIVRLV